jgi:signal peptidase I
MQWIAVRMSAEIERRISMSGSTRTQNNKQGPGQGGEKKGDSLREIVGMILLVAAGAFLFRAFMYQPFNIPSGSMIPTLLVGDYLYVSKLSYGYSKYSFSFYGVQPEFSGRIWGAEPKRGDVLVFKLPTDNSTDYIKRCIGLPGDKVQVIHGVLHINGEPVKLKRVEDFALQEGSETPRMLTRYEETLPNGVKHMILRESASDDAGQNNTREFAVPDGHYFMMGDNRDHSLDSRFISHVGYVPRDNLIGRASFVFLSFEPETRWYNPVSWFTGLRWSREFTLIN